MRKILVISFLAGSMCAYGNIFTTVSVEKLPMEQEEGVRMAGISPQGDYILTTTDNNKGLSKVSLATGQSQFLTDAVGAGIGPVVSADGKQVLYRDVRYTEDHLRKTSLRLISVENLSEKLMQEPTRCVKPYGFRQNTAFVIKEDSEEKPVQRKIENVAEKETKSVVVYLEDLQLRLNIDGKVIPLTPNGTDVNYIWPSVSPDGTKILYYVSGQGAYVCDLDGSNVHFISHDCRAPQWYDNQIVVGMDDADNGETVISSRIVAYTLEGDSQALTDGSSMTMYPFCSSKAGLVACSTNDGEVCLIRLTR